MKKRWLRWILAIASAGLLLCGHFAYIAIADRIEYNNNLRKLAEYYDSKVTAFAEENKTLGTVDIVFLGDSLTDGCDLGRYYPELNAANRGIGGDTTTGVLKRLDVSVFELKPKAVVMLIGGNNLATMFEDYEDILKAFKTKAPDMKVLLVSLTAMGGSFADKNALAMANNTRIQALAETYGYEYVDIFSSLYDENTGSVYPRFVVADGVHLSEEGYELISGIIKNALDY